MKIRIIGLSLVFAALTSETVAQPVQHYYDESTAAFYDQYPKASYLSVDEMKKAFEQHSQGDWMQRRCARCWGVARRPLCSCPDGR